jgi:hypothetical protein
MSLENDAKNTRLSSKVKCITGFKPLKTLVISQTNKNSQQTAAVLFFILLISL